MINLEKYYRYSECFLSIQGEGMFTGVPSVFLRLWGCNFQCNGFSSDNNHPPSFDPARIKTLAHMPVLKTGCDTRYAWHKDYAHLSQKGSASEICDAMEALCPRFLHGNSRLPIHLVITGGEPMISQNCLIDVFHVLEERDNLPTEVTIETNGTQALSPEMQALIRNYKKLERHWMWSVSPKLKISGETSEAALLPDCVSTYRDLSDFGQLKFVVDGSEACWEDMENAIELFRKAGVNWPVWVMPVGATLEQQESIQHGICMETIRRGYSFSPRLQNWLFGNTPGT